MSPTIDTIFDAALSLPSEDRARLAEKLVESLPDEELTELCPEWAAEIRHRIEAYKRGEIKGIPAEDVMQSRLRQRIWLHA